MSGISTVELRHQSYLVTRQALEPVPVLPLEQVHDEAIIALLVDLPLGLRSHFRRQRLELGFPLRRHLDGRRFVLDPVEVFVQSIQDEREELLRVVLICTRELLRERDDLFLPSVRCVAARPCVASTHPECDWRQERVILFPKRLEQLRERIRQVALHAHRIVHIDRPLIAPICH